MSGISHSYRITKINAANEARKELWNILNTYPTSIQILIDCVSDSFRIPVKNCSFLENDMIIMIENLEVEGNITINSKMRIAVRNAMGCFYEYGYISKDMYDICIQSPELLYNIILNHGTKIQIKL